MSSNTFFDVVNIDLIPKSWETKLLKDVATINQASSNLREFEWINYTDIASVGTHTAEFPTKLKVTEAPSRARRILKSGDTVLSTVRPNRKSFFFYNGQWSNPIASTGFAVVSPRLISDAEYLYAVLTSDFAVKTYEAICEGGAYPAFNPSRLNELRIPWPPEEVRNIVGRFFMNLESKIEVNKALSKTLEDIAEALFKSWFIDFDPVKAKMAGEVPVGVDAETAALFPDSIEDSVAGSYPRGWRVGDLGEVLKIYDSKRIPVSSTERKKRFGNFPYYGATGILDYLDDYIFEGPHVLVGEDGTVITKAGTPVVQYVWGKFWVNNHAHVLQAKNGFSVEQLKLMLETVQVDNFVTGAVQLKLNQLNLKSIPCIIPDVFVSEAFNKIIQPLFAKIRILSEENQTLVALRDAFLPKLISGELQIPEEMLTE